jgi:hypothetical protein
MGDSTKAKAKCGSVHDIPVNDGSCLRFLAYVDPSSRQRLQVMEPASLLRHKPSYQTLTPITFKLNQKILKQRCWMIYSVSSCGTVLLRHLRIDINMRLIPTLMNTPVSFRPFYQTHIQKQPRHMQLLVPAITIANTGGEGLSRHHSRLQSF